VRSVGIALGIALSTAASAQELAPRKQHNFSVALLSSALVEEPTPFTGVQVTWNRNAHLSVDLSVETLGYFTLTVLGMKLYALGGALSPYAFFRGGVSFQTFDSQVPPWLLPGAGLEYLHRRRFAFFIEGSPGITYRKDGDTRVYGVVTAGVGYRFEIRTSPHVRPLVHAEPGKLGERCTEVEGMPGAYVCAAGLVCREMTCVREGSDPE